MYLKSPRRRREEKYGENALEKRKKKLQQLQQQRGFWWQGGGLILLCRAVCKRLQKRRPKNHGFEKKTCFLNLSGFACFFGQNLARYTVFDKESESEVKSTENLELGGQN